MKAIKNVEAAKCDHTGQEPKVITIIELNQNHRPVTFMLEMERLKCDHIG